MMFSSNLGAFLAFLPLSLIATRSGSHAFVPSSVSLRSISVNHQQLGAKSEGQDEKQQPAHHVPLTASKADLKGGAVQAPQANVKAARRQHEPSPYFAETAPIRKEKKQKPAAATAGSKPLGQQQADAAGEPRQEMKNPAVVDVPSTPKQAEKLLDIKIEASTKQESKPVEPKREAKAAPEPKKRPAEPKAEAAPQQTKKSAEPQQAKPAAPPPPQEKSPAVPKMAEPKVEAPPKQEKQPSEPKVELPRTPEKQLAEEEPAAAEAAPFAEKEPETQADTAFLSILPRVQDEKQIRVDENYMKMAIETAQAGLSSPFPKPPVGALLVAQDGRILGQARSDYSKEAVRGALEDAGLDITPLSEWCVSWPTTAQLRQDMASATLYVTLEPSLERQGTALPPLTHLIQQSGIARIVIGCADPIASRATKGAAALHEAGIAVSLGSVLHEDCQNLVEGYANLANSKLHRMSRNHFRQFGRPLGFLHCSVVDSDNIEAFARHGNAFGTDFGGTQLSFRNFGSYEIAPPPEVIWADDDEDEDEEFDMDMFSVDFDAEEFDTTDPMPLGSPMMPWYEQVDAVVCTFPRSGNGPPDDNSLGARLNGLKWLAKHGNDLPTNVERILVMDATDLPDLPLDNNDPNIPSDVNVESFWKGQGRKQTRVLLRRGANEKARAAAVAAANAAASAAQAAEAAANAIESGDAARNAEAALEYQKAAQAETEFIQKELEKTQKIKTRLQELGVAVETLEGGEPVDVMKYLGVRNGYRTVVWRAGCWGERGVRSILDGAFQFVSAHLAVDAVGGKFWQLQLAEMAVQAACGPSQQVKIFAEQEDISLEYCDNPDADPDCSMTFEGRPVRHIRLDCRVALVDADRPRKLVPVKTKRMSRKMIEEQAPWFL